MLPHTAGRTTVPALPEPFVPRPGLLTALDDSIADPVLVCAPAGFGKTTLLTHWARTTAVVDGIDWADLTPGPEMSVWPVVLAALRACPAVTSHSALHELGRCGSAVSAHNLVADILKGLDALPVRVGLVLHDAHEVTAPAELRHLETLLAAHPAGVRLVLCSRRDRLLPVGALGFAGRLREIRADHLRLSVDETREVISRSGLHLDLAGVRAVQACTGGWPTGVRLACAALRGGADPGIILRQFRAAAAPAADFLVGEVLARLSGADRDLLAAIGIGDPVTAALADVLSDRTDAGEVLDRLVRDSGLVLRGPGERFQVHPFVASHLRTEQSEAEDGTVRRHGRAARWWAGQDDPIAAFRHAVRADDATLLVALAHRFAGRLLVTGNHPLLARVLSGIGQRTVAADPWLAPCAALIRIEAGQEEPADVTARDPAAAGTTGPGPAASVRLAILRSITAVLDAASTGIDGAAPCPVDLARSRLDTPEWTGLALVGVGGRAMLVDADMAAAVRAFDEALALARTNGFGYLEMQCLALLGSVACVAGDYPAMVTAAAAADAAATAGGWETSPLATASRWMLAYGALLRSEPVVAHRLTEEALRRGGPTLHPRYLHSLRAVRGAALFDLGRRHRGLQEMQGARAALGELYLSHQQAAVLAVLEHHAATALGRSEDAGDVTLWLARRIGTRAEVLLMRAWAEQSAGRDRAAREIVGPVLDGTVTPILPCTIVEVLLVEASAGVSGGDVPRARGALRDALASGASLGVVRPFATAGGPARELLVDHLARGGSAEPFALRALAVGGRPDPRTARLDDIELTVLERLPSSLSVAEIAGELQIPAEDARARIRTVYRKLGVSSRRTAVSTAYECGLLH